MRDTIALDLERLHPGDAFYSAADVQGALLNVLLVWSLENPSVGYRQGMHELASLVFSQRARDAAAAAAAAGHEAGKAHIWGQGDAPPTDAVRNVTSSAGSTAPDASYVEHDTYAMFSALMGPPLTHQSGGGCALGGAVRVVAYYEDPEKKGGRSEVQAACDRVFKALGAVDVPMHAHLVKLGVEPQLYLLRWLRVLFSREFHLEDAMTLWDAIIAENDGKEKEKGGREGDGRPAAHEFIEAFAVSMLLFVRADVLAQDDFGMCLRRLQRFPPVEDIAALTERARAIARAVMSDAHAIVPGQVIAGITTRDATGGIDPDTMTSAGGLMSGAMTSGGAGGTTRGANDGPPPPPHGTGAGLRGGVAASVSRQKAGELLAKARDASAVGRQRAGDFLAKAAGAAAQVMGHLLLDDAEVAATSYTMPAGAGGGAMALGERGGHREEANLVSAGGRGRPDGAAAADVATGQPIPAPPPTQKDVNPFSSAAQPPLPSFGSVAMEGTPSVASAESDEERGGTKFTTSFKAVEGAAEMVASTGYEQIETANVPLAAPQSVVAAPALLQAPTLVPAVPPVAVQVPPEPASKPPTKNRSIFGDDDDDDDGLGLGVSVSMSRPKSGGGGGLFGDDVDSGSLFGPQRPACSRPEAAPGGIPGGGFSRLGEATMRLFDDEGGEDPLFAPTAKITAKIGGRVSEANGDGCATSGASPVIVALGAAAEGVKRAIAELTASHDEGSREELRVALAKIHGVMAKFGSPHPARCHQSTP